jgi:hypothetical protein
MSVGGCGCVSFLALDRVATKVRMPEGGTVAQVLRCRRHRALAETARTRRGRTSTWNVEGGAQKVAIARPREPGDRHGPSRPRAGPSRPRAGPSRPRAGPSRPRAGPSRPGMARCKSERVIGLRGMNGCEQARDDPPRAGRAQTRDDLPSEPFSQRNCSVPGWPIFDRAPLGPVLKLIGRERASEALRKGHGTGCGPDHGADATGKDAGGQADPQAPNAIKGPLWHMV